MGRLPVAARKKPKARQGKRKKKAPGEGLGRPGRKTLLSPAVHATIISYLRLGSWKNQAAEAAGVSVDSMDNWIARGQRQDAEEPYATFAADVRTAQAEDAVLAMGVVTKAAEGGDWRAAAWKLERKYPLQYGPARLQKGVKEAPPPTAADEFERRSLADNEYYQDHGYWPEDEASTLN